MFEEIIVEFCVLRRLFMRKSNSLEMVLFSQLSHTTHSHKNVAFSLAHEHNGFVVTA